MNVSGYTFNYCTLQDAAGQPYIIVPPDRNGLPCFPGDLVCDECDTECKNPFAVRGIWFATSATPSARILLR